jgi:N6-L-threonylcarbamoyladenine synthase
MGSLLVGVSFAKAFARALNIPLIDVNHMQAHVLAHFIEEPRPSFPFICLTVSGGHTQLVLVSDHLAMEVIGETQDDAVGEAFDKTAKLLGLPYPGGPLVDMHAKKGNPRAFDFPVTRMPGLNYSFSGIKTAVLYFLRDRLQEKPDFIAENLSDLCASIQYTLIEMLLIKLKEAVKIYQVKEIAIAGGVSANSELRLRFLELADRHGINAHIPPFAYCTDNAAMIGIAGQFKLQAGDTVGLDVAPMARLKMA